MNGAQENKGTRRDPTPLTRSGNVEKGIERGK